MTDRPALVARFHLIDGMKNCNILDAREGANREVVLSLYSVQGTPLALSNLQARVRFPAFWGDRAETLKAIHSAANSGVERVRDVELTPPTRAKREPGKRPTYAEAVAILADNFGPESFEAENCDTAVSVVAWLFGKESDRVCRDALKRQEQGESTTAGEVQS